jgi:hypothetical protein
MEDKDSVKERLQRSPDLADALALTFAIPDQPAYEGSGCWRNDGRGRCSRTTTRWPTIANATRRTADGSATRWFRAIPDQAEIRGPAGDTALRARIAAAVYGTKPKTKGGSDTAATLLTGPSGLANPLPSGSKMLLGV